MPWALKAFVDITVNRLRIQYHRQQGRVQAVLMVLFNDSVNEFISKKKAVACVKSMNTVTTCRHNR